MNRSTRSAANISTLLIVFLLGSWGCSDRIDAPALSPSEAGPAAVKAFDRNNDGKIDETELEQCPALKSALEAIDKDKDGAISGDEIKVRLEHFEKANIGLISIPCQVTLDGKPLADATVTLEPELFVKDAIQPASGVSDGQGQVTLQTADTDLPGVNCGFYKIRVSKKDASGQESIPAKYNTATTLGREIAPDIRGGVELRLVSKS